MTYCTFKYLGKFGKNIVISCEERNICIPLNQPFHWFCSRLIFSHKIPKFAEEDFTKVLREFIDKEQTKYHDVQIDELYTSLKNDEHLIDEVVEYTERAIKEQTSTRFQNYSRSDEEIFGQVYSKKIKSPIAMDLIQLENSFAVAVETEVIERNRALENLQKTVLAQTEALINSDQSDTTDAVNKLQSLFHEEYEILKSKWNSRISSLKEGQRRDYRSFVMSVEEQLPQNTNPSQLGKKRDLGDSSKIDNIVYPLRKSPDATHHPRSESFVVQLGRQLRTSYNLKLIQADPMHLTKSVAFREPSITSTNSSAVNLAERLSCSLNIYSNELTGLVLLVDNESGQTNEGLSEVCERSTDFHFPEYDQQLAEIRQTANDNFVQRKSMNSTTVPSSKYDGVKRKTDSKLKPGDVYITRHTNLASCIGGVAGGGGGIEVVFHVVSSNVSGKIIDEDCLRNPSPFYCALSAILRVCFQYNITTLSIPLLFTRHLSEYMTSNWCHHRAEAVLKAVKGILMELATWRGQVLHTLLFLIPPELSNPPFSVFSNLVTFCFQQPNPILAVCS